MAVVLFPKSLPSPSLSETTPTERRLTSDLSGGPWQTAAKQQDYLGTQEAEWNILTPYQAEKFDTWWRYNLIQGGLWFKSTWPAPQGWVGLTRRFLGVPRWTHLQSGHWRVSATFQVRGRGMDPDADYTVKLSRPYPVISDDAMDVIHSIASGHLLSWLPGEMDVVHALLGGTLNEPLFSYNFWPAEGLDSSHALTGGSLIILLKTYGDWPPEQVDTAHALTGGSLTVKLLTYSNGLPEHMDVTHTLTGGTLT